MTTELGAVLSGLGARRAGARRRGRRAAPHAAGEGGVYAAICKALLNGQLRPGTQLRERQLSLLFDVTRGCIRKVLHRLGHEGRLDLHRNRGAFVPRPSLAEAKAAYEARRALEAGIVAVLATRITGEALRAVRRHLRLEGAAAQTRRRDQSVTLAGGFHLLLADLLGNAELAGALRKLVSRTQLMVSLFELPASSVCGVDEHARVVAALAKRDPAAAMHAMIDHLGQVEGRVIAARREPERVDLEEIFGAAERSPGADRRRGPVAGTRAVRRVR